LADAPALPVKIPGKNIIKVAALVVKAVVVSDAAKRELSRCVKLVSNEEAANPPFLQKGKGSKHKDGYRPQPDGVFVRTHSFKVLTHKREVPQHPVEHPVGIGPNPGCVGNVIGKVTVGIQGCKPVPPGLVDKNRMDLTSHFL
jgi:hypothetical protein